MNNYFDELEAKLEEYEVQPLGPSMQLACAQARLLMLIFEKLDTLSTQGKETMMKPDPKGDAVIKKPAMKKCPVCKKEYKGKTCPCGGKGGKMPAKSKAMPKGFEDHDYS